MNDATRRAIRTLLDVLLAVIGAGVIDTFVVNLTPEARGVIVVALTGAISVIKNALEDAGKVPALLKAPASAGANPVPRDAGIGQVALIVVVVLAILFVLFVLLPALGARL